MSAVATVSSSFSSTLGASRVTAAVPPAVRRGAWQLHAGQALSLKASAPSVLRIRQGRVWVTRDATDQWGSEDLVLAPGDQLLLAAGERIVMEAWNGDGATYAWDAQAPAAGVAASSARTSSA